MSDDYGSDFITVTDEDGNDFELEHLGTLEYKGSTYMAFVRRIWMRRTRLRLILLRAVEENGEQLLADIDDESELNAVYEQFMEELFDDEDDTDE